MSKMFDITKSVFYRRRYWFGHSVTVILLASLLFVAGFLVPGEVSTSELTSIIKSGSIDLNGDLTNLPFHYLQHLSLTFFGVTLLGIKLPALILGFMTAIGMALLLRRWFKGAVAVLASMLVIATGQFLFLTQNGSSSILFLFWPTMLLLLGTLVSNRAKGHAIWKVLFFVAAALSLYTPLSIYVLISIAIAAMIHPHLRHIIRRLSKVSIVLGGCVMLGLLAPLVYSIIMAPQRGLALLGIPREWPDLVENGQILFSQYAGFTNLGSGSVLLPVFGLASMLVICYGFLRLVRHRTATQSHVVLVWMILLLPVLVVNPSFVSIMFVPQFLLLAVGLDGILRRWYKLFPMNPYARIAGLLPIVVLVSSMVLFGFERYTYAYRYAPDVLQNFSRDIVIIPDKEDLVVSADELPLYRVVAQYKPNLNVYSPDQLAADPSLIQDEYAVTAAAYDGWITPSSVVVSNRQNDGARFYIYKSPEDGIIDEVQHTEGE